MSWIGTLSLLLSCEDKGILNADRNFSRSNLQTVSVDTFSVVTSTTLIDSIPTSNSNLLLIGNYKDAFLGNVDASTYFQIGYVRQFKPEATAIFDSIALILPYSDYSYGDTTQNIQLNVHELRETPRLRTPIPYRLEDKVSLFTLTSGALYNTSKLKFDPTPLASKTTVFYPHRDSIAIRLPNAFGQNWFDVARADNTQFFTDVNEFLSFFFKGLHISTSSSTPGAIVGFLTQRTKIRIYYRGFQGDLFTNLKFDFPLVNPALQFNSVVSDRTGTQISSLARRQAISSRVTSNVSFVQSNTGIGTKVEFPTLKNFIQNKRNILIDAVLEVYPVQNTYSSYTPLPKTLTLMVTDDSNVPFDLVPPLTGGTYTQGNISYDREYGNQTKYSFTITNYLIAEASSTISSRITPIFITTVAPIFNTEVNRVVLGNQFHATNRIKLKLIYSYVSN
ncbi:MAG: DUF4270 family protein [Flammeovirgaceae bacterium]